MQTLNAPDDPGARTFCPDRRLAHRLRPRTVLLAGAATREPLAAAQAQVQSRGGRLRSLRCNVRRSIDSARALAEILPSFSRSTRVMYSHSARCADIGFLPMGTLSLP